MVLATDSIGDDDRVARIGAQLLTPETSPGALIRLVNQRVGQALDTVLADENVTALQWRVLAAIFFCEKHATSAKLARDLAYDPGAMTRVIDNLELRGLLERQQRNEDRRVVPLLLTTKGNDVVLRCRERVATAWSIWFDGWTNDEVDMFMMQLHMLAQTLEKRDQDDRPSRSSR